MDGAEAPPSGGWCLGIVRGVQHPHPDAVVLRLEVRDRTDHLPGQHYVFRLTAEDGYFASQSYSPASAPADPMLEFYVERLDDGGELRGPIGGWFVWAADVPAVGLAGGTGVIPLVAMLRHARALGREHLLRQLVSARTLDDVPYRDELAGHRLVLTRTEYGSRAASRLTADDVRPLLDGGSRIGYVCGSAGFAETASRLLVEIGVPAPDVRVEQFGPTT